MAFKLTTSTLSNTNYRTVVYTTEQLQLVLMSLKPGENVPIEIHPNTTQFIKVEQGDMLVWLNGNNYILKQGDAIVIPANTYHYVSNIGNYDLKFYTIYSPPEHPKNHIDITKPHIKDEHHQH